MGNARLTPLRQGRTIPFPACSTRPTASLSGGAAFDTPGHHGPLYGLARLGVAPELARPGTGEG